MAYVFLVFDLAIVVYYMEIYEGSILPSSSSSGVISLQKNDPNTDAAFPVWEQERTMIGILKKVV